jgi:hypothetical protein
MITRVMLSTAVAVAAVLLLPAEVDGWGAARVSATRVGPYGGVHHASRTVAAGPRGVYAGGRAGYAGYGGAAYRGYGGAAYRGGAYYRGYSGYGAAGYRYGYIR